MQPFRSEMDTCENFAVLGGACEGMLKLRLAGTPSFGVGTRQSAKRVGSTTGETGPSNPGRFENHNYRQTDTTPTLRLSAHRLLP